MNDQTANWRKALPTNATADGAIPAVNTLSNEQLEDLEAAIAVERKDRHQRFFDQATAFLHCTPRRRRPRRRRASTPAEADPPTLGAVRIMTTKTNASAVAFPRRKLKSRLKALFKEGWDFDPLKLVRLLRDWGHSYPSIATIGFWFDDAPDRPLTGPQLQCWYETEIKHRR
jgi:hypothetical protein